MKIWLDGVLMAAEAARIDPADRGFLLGDGLFETLAVRDGRAVAVTPHLARLEAGADILGIPLPCSRDTLADALDGTVAANALNHGLARLTLSRGPGGRGVTPPETPTPRIVVTVRETEPGAPPPVSVVVARATRRNELSPLAGIKSLNYLDGILARREALARGADDALLLNTRGRLVEGTDANLFAVLEGALVTPPLSEGALPGILRGRLLAALGAGERALVPEDLAGASEIWLTNSAGVRPVIAVDGRAVGAGRPGPRWRALGGIAEGRIG